MMAIGNKLVQFNSPQFDYLSVVPKNLDYKTVHIFAYSSTREQSNKRSGTRLKTERAFETRSLRARKTRTARCTDFFEKKNDGFAVYLKFNSREIRLHHRRPKLTTGTRT